MQTARILQAVILMLMMALAASCATSNQYVSKLFGPRPVVQRDTMQLVRFLEIDSLNNNREGWVKTDIMKKYSSAGTAIPVIEEPAAKTSNPENHLPAGQGIRSKRTRE